MRTFRSVSLGVVVAITVLLPRFASAQINQLFKPVISNVGACPSRLDPPPTSAADLKKCVEALATEQRVPAAPPSSPALPQTPASQMRQDALARHTALLQRYAAFLAAKKAVDAGLTTQANDTDLVAAHSLLDQTGASLHAELQAHGLEETSPIVGELRVGPVVTSTGTVTGSPAPDHSTGGDALAHIVWQTAHAGALDRPSGGDFAIEGQFGLQPALTLLQTQQSGNQTQLAAQFQQGLVIDVGISGSRFAGNTEWSFVARGGFVRFGQLAQVVQSNGANYLAIPVGTSDQVAPYFEIGLRGSLYDRPMSLVHLSLGTLSPRLMGEVVYRRDSRFSQVAAALNISKPEDRIILRFMLDGLNVIDKRTEPESNKIFKVGFGFDYQRGWTNGVPPGFSFLIRGDADLLKILQGGHTDQ